MPPGELKFLRCEECELGQFNPTFVGDEEFYEKLQKNAWYYLTEKEEYRIASRWISKHELVLEIGAGSGEFALHIGNPQRYVGLEFNAAAVTKASERALQVSKISGGLRIRSHGEI